MVPPRPVYAGPCQCVWPKEFERQRTHVQQDAKMETVTSPVTAAVNWMLPGDVKISGSTGDEKQQAEPVTDENGFADAQDSFPARNTKFQPMSTAPYETSSTPIKKTVTQPPTLSKADISRGEQKSKALVKTGLVGQRKPDVLARKIKKTFAKSTENKIRDLYSYREDVVVTLSSLIPTYQQVANSTIVYHPDSHLCPSCTSTLSHCLYYSPAKYEPYLYEHATRGYLALLDDATASMDLAVPMETVSHHELERILRGELAAIEWRISLKMADFHKRTNYLNLFPIKLGEYAELRVSQDPPKRPEGFFKKISKKAGKSVGFAGAAAASPQTQVSGPSGE